MKIRIQLKRLLLFHLILAVVVLTAYLGDWAYTEREELRNLVQAHKEEWYFIFGSLAVALGIVTVIFVFFDEKKRRSPTYIADRSVVKFDAKKYPSICKAYTSSQLEKLYASPEYKKMQSQKGSSSEKWNWQEARRLKVEQAAASGATVDASDSE